ncbi:MAG UNVERIFIED_CONTAM: hypothetical protein LVR18_25525 [Planctomycetaceae bacterium]
MPEPTGPVIPKHSPASMRRLTPAQHRPARHVFETHTVKLDLTPDGSEAFGIGGLVISSGASSTSNTRSALARLA